MGKRVLRIDDRLIHGQIIHSWLKYAEASIIVVADDLLVEDKMHQTMMKLVVPKSVKLIMLSIVESADYLNSLNENENILIIMRNPETTLKLINSGFKIDYINLGNISNHKSIPERLHLLKNIHVTDIDISCLKEIISKGIRVEIKIIPTDAPIDVINLLKSHKL